jgi:hypothetical protein
MVLQRAVKSKDLPSRMTTALISIKESCQDLHTVALLLLGHSERKPSAKRCGSGHLVLEVFDDRVSSALSY